MKRYALGCSLSLCLLTLPATGIELVPTVQASAATEGLRRCVGVDGVTIFTDRRCQDLDAAEVAAPGNSSPVTPSATVIRVRTCAHNQDDLLFGVRAALENHDANRLADFYHWTGMGTRQGYQLMDRLTTFSKRPVVDVQLITSGDPLAAAEPEFTALYEDDNEEVYEDEDADGLAIEPAPPPRTRPADLLRVDQMRGEADIDSLVTYFHLRTNAGCWWMQF